MVTEAAAPLINHALRHLRKIADLQALCVVENDNSTRNTLLSQVAADAAAQAREAS